MTIGEFATVLLDLVAANWTARNGEVLINGKEIRSIDMWLQRPDYSSELHIRLHETEKPNDGRGFGLDAGEPSAD